jgi:prepilin-type processing-associated H-X9-DG protein
MNSLLSHKSRRYGEWTLMRFVNEVGTSQFVAFSERNAAAFGEADGGDPRQDDYDIWLGTGIIKPWLAHDRHGGVANYLYLDGHVATLPWSTAVVDMYPDKVVLSEDGTYPY